MKRLLPQDRKTEIIDAALRVAERPGAYSKLTRVGIATEAGCAEGLVSRYFGTMNAFKRVVMRAAIQRSNLSIIAQGLACGDNVAAKVHPDIKNQALKNLAR